jgi:ketosteroid isomerase-like protein
MSQENVEIARRFYEPAAKGKAELLAAMPRILALCDPEVEWTEDPTRADSQTRRGRAGMRAALEGWLDAFGEYSFTAQRFVDCGDDVLVIGREEGRGAVSGAPVSTTNHELVTIRDGKIVRFREFYDERAALEAAGLSEWE